MSRDYKETLNLPDTPFQMKANLAAKEPETIKFWDKNKIYHKLIEKRKNSPMFILHDGPPYANGHIHQGHILNKILKDIVVKYKNMTGYLCEFIPGWDCHGLPIEHNIEKDLGEKKASMSSVEFRKKCKEFALKFMNIQREEFKRLGVFGDWENPYLTMDYDYEATIVREFGRFVGNNSVYRGRKPVLWCHICKTALAEAEVEYEEITSPSVFVKFPFFKGFEEKFPVLKNTKGYVVIWTTTPWTLPANLAICFHPDFDYVLEKINDEFFIVAEGLHSKFHFATSLPAGEIIEKFKGSFIEGAECKHPFIDRTSLIILGEHVTLDVGTGCVHTAPGHGEEDYEVGLKYNLPVYAPVDEEGKFTEEFSLFKGEVVFDTDEKIIQILKEKNMLIHTEKIHHSYPHCWRSKNPVIFRAASQWFISMERNELRKKSLEEIEKTQWIPKWGKERIFAMVSMRPDWCISRQRQWGIPIPALHCSGCGEYILKKEFVDKVANIFEHEGSDAWFEKDVSEFLDERFVCKKCGEKNFYKENNILDVWFESGVSYAAVMEKIYGYKNKVDLYLEGSDQHRGWFQSSLLSSVGTREQSPYNAVLTHGFVVDGEGKKMSKTLGNYIPPEEIIDKQGAEIFRLWVAAEDYREDIKLSDEIIQRLIEAYRKIRNTFRFILGNISDFNPEKDALSYEKLNFIDKWALMRLNKITNKILNAYETYNFHVVFHTVKDFFVVDMSSFYLDILKDRLYCSSPKSEDRKAAQTVLYKILKDILILFAPILSFTCEECYQYLPKLPSDPESIFLCDMPERVSEFPSEIQNDMDLLMEVRNIALKALEEARAYKHIGHSLEAKIVIKVNKESLHFSLLKKIMQDLPLFFIVSQVEVEPVGETIIPVVEVYKAEGNKCHRCWNYSHSVGKDPEFSDCCERCVKVLKELM